MLSVIYELKNKLIVLSDLPLRLLHITPSAGPLIAGYTSTSVLHHRTVALAVNELKRYIDW